jgi:flagellar biosynthetic protein FliR
MGEPIATLGWQTVMAQLPWFGLYFTRIGTMIAVVPFFGRRGDSRWPRLMIALVVSLLLYLPRHGVAPGPLPLEPLALGLLTGREALLGLGVGFALSGAFAMLRSAGSILGQEMGFGFAQVADPTTGAASTVMAQIVETLVLLSFLALDGLHACLRLFQATLEAIPVGSAFDLGRLVDGLQVVLATGFELAITVAFPVLGVLLVATVTLLLVARAVPQLHLMEIAYSLRILLALLLAAGCLGLVAPELLEGLARVYELSRAMLVP